MSQLFLNILQLIFPVEPSLYPFVSETSFEQIYK